MAGLLFHAAHDPDRAAFILGHDEFVETYGELEARSRRIALWLRSLGLKEGDGVAILLGNVPSFFDVYWATQRLGLYLTPLNWHLSASEIAFIADNCDARVLIASAELAELALQLKPLLSDKLEGFYSIAGLIPGYERVEDYVGAVADAPLDKQRAGSVMLYSSGTTGKPKGIRKALPNAAFDDPKWIDAQPRFVRLFGFREGDRYLCPAPLYHAAPLRSCAALHVLGGTVCVMPRYDAEDALRMIERHRITVSQWVPTHLRRLLDLPEPVRSRYDLASLRVAVHAAAPCPASVKRQIIEWWGPILIEYYAGTEGGGTIITAGDWLTHPGSVGKPWAGVDVAILDDNSQPLTRPGDIGAVYFRDRGAGIVRFAYHKDEEKSRKVYRQFDGGDWFTLGDIGYRDKEGFLYLTDRQSDMIISGGVNVYPQETENCLLEHPKVADVAVIGIADASMGEQVKAVVISRPGVVSGPALEKELIEYTRARIAHFKCPRTIDFVDQLPRTETGKLQRRVLRDHYRQIAAGT